MRSATQQRNEPRLIAILIFEMQLSRLDCLPARKPFASFHASLFEPRRVHLESPRSGFDHYPRDRSRSIRLKEVTGTRARIERGIEGIQEGTSGTG